ncbi:hypothetical protein [Streptomyces filipinensis]|uniref:hypothetical protein n=1 Tax=Streptomyces filipinensis TaxID=66887 RepID=UPI00177FF0D2|nr:hypothetical protein [Streptomyces filipinensis]
MVDACGAMVPLHYGAPKTAAHLAEQARHATVHRPTAGLVRPRAQDLYEVVPAQHHHERAVRDFREVLAA